MNVRNRILVCSFVATAFCVSAGCDTSTSTGASGGGQSMEELAAKLQGKKPAAAAPASAPAAEAEANNNAAAPTGRETAATAPAGTVPDDAKKASERAPLKSNPSTYLGAISSANRNIRTMLDDVSWKKSVELFEAEHGRKPRDTKEFLERVRGEGTPLPQIARDHTYLYVPEEGQFGELYSVPIDQAPTTEQSPGR